MSLTAINEATTRDKRKWDPIVTRFVFRPLSMPVAAALLPTRVSADVVSFVGVGLLFLSILIAAFLPLGGMLVIVGIGMLLFSVADVVDGALARARQRPGQLGSWVDGICGYLGMFGFHLAWLLVVFAAGAPRWIAFLILLSIGCNLLLRLVYAKSKMFVGEIEKIDADDETPDGAGRLRTWFYLLTSNLGVTGFFLPVVLVSAVFPLTLVLPVIYAGIYTLFLVAGIAYFYRLNAARDGERRCS